MRVKSPPTCGHSLARKLNKKCVDVPHLNIFEKDKKPSLNSIKIFKENSKLEYKVYNYVKELNN